MTNPVLKTLFLLVLCKLIPMAAGAQLTVEVRSAAVFQTSKHFREHYGSVLPSYQIELRTTPCFYPCWENWANYDYSTKKHQVRHCCDGKSKIEIHNFSLGVDYVFNSCGNFDFYVGLGPALAVVKLKNHSCFFKKKKVNNPFGVVVKTGMRYYFFSRLFLDIFVDYLYQPVNYHHRVDLGGFKTGAGIGLQF